MSAVARPLNIVLFAASVREQRNADRMILAVKKAAEAKGFKVTIFGMFLFPVLFSVLSNFGFC